MKKETVKTMFVILLACVAVEATFASSTSSGVCETAPLHAQPADANYKLHVAGEPDLFLPGELYTVSLQGVNSGQGATPFVGFTIWAEFETGDNKDQTKQYNQSLGSFQAYDAQTKHHEFCKPAVDNATAHPKTEIQVIWSAPINAADTCVKLCARATPAEESASPSVLARKLCAASAAPASFTRQPPIVEPCCACDEAKYEVTFDSLWSRNTHPRDFPPESARAHFGDVIGASHTAQYRVWQEGRVASIGLRRLADDGATTALEKELKEESDHIRTIIKARGISWQQVAGGAGIPSTFAVFRVDAKHHLVSLAAKMAPSPDWIVGVSALELCNANCTWRTSITLPLYPYDAGTDGGLAYTSRRQPTVPSAPVRALRPDWPRDVRSPFFSTSGEMRPFARLRLNRLRLYEKSCDTAETVEHLSETAGGACATHAWGAWGPCSVTCGEGRAAQQRHYVWPARAYAEACRIPLTNYQRCFGPRRHCRAASEFEADPAESSGPCAVSAWSAWSACSGCGVRARTRHYLAPRAHKRCHVGHRAATVLSQAMPCSAGPCERPAGILPNSTNYDWFYVDKPHGECPTTPWGSWSPCSARCGRGRRLRTRLYLARDTRVQAQLTRTLLHKWNQRFAELQQLAVRPDNVTAGDPEVDKIVYEQIEKCHATHSQQEALCDGSSFECLNASMARETCYQPMLVGHCRSYEDRWFYDAAHDVCEPFGYTGCGGSANNFRTREQCKKLCNKKNLAQNVTTVAPSPVVSETHPKKMKPTPSSAANEVMSNDAPYLPHHDEDGPDEEHYEDEGFPYDDYSDGTRDGEENEGAEVDVDCEVGPWLGWTECHGTCEYGIKLNYRLVTVSNSGKGRLCPRLVKSRTCKPPHCWKGHAPTDDPHATGQPDYLIKNEDRPH